MPPISKKARRNSTPHPPIASIRFLGHTRRWITQRILGSCQIPFKVKFFQMSDGEILTKGPIVSSHRHFAFVVLAQVSRIILYRRRLAGGTIRNGAMNKVCVKVSHGYAIIQPRIAYPEMRQNDASDRFFYRTATG